MLKSDLGARSQNDAYMLASVEDWSNPGVVVRSIYEGQSRLVDPISGKVYATELSPSVDIMISGKIIKEVPVRCLDRVNYEPE